MPAAAHADPPDLRLSEAAGVAGSDHKHPRPVPVALRASSTSLETMCSMAPRCIPLCSPRLRAEATQTDLLLSPAQDLRHLARHVGWPLCTLCALGSQRFARPRLVKGCVPCRLRHTLTP